MFVADFDALMTDIGGSYLKHCGSMSAIFTVMMDDRVPSRAIVFLVLVLLRPTMEKNVSASALECGRTNTRLAIVESLGNLLIPATFEKH